MRVVRRRREALPMEVLFILMTVHGSLIDTTTGNTFQNSAGGTGSSSTSQATDVVINCTSAGGGGGPFPVKGRLQAPKQANSDGSSGSSSSGANSGNGAAGRGMVMYTKFDDQSLRNVNLTDDCGSVNIFKQPGPSETWKSCVVTGQITKSTDDGTCVRDATRKLAESMTQRPTPCLLILYAKQDIVNSETVAKTLAENEATLKDQLLVFLAELPAGDSAKYLDPASCTVPIRSSDDDQNQQDSLLNNFSRTSVLFVSVSFIILMVISLAWLVFYYVQRFRYAHAKDRLARRLFNAAKKALTKIPAKTLRQGDKELDSDCPVCIEPYHSGDVIRILPCKHVFHKTCVDPWLLEHRTCPMCKMDILKAFGYHFGHSEESVRDADQISAGGQSSDGGSGATGTAGRGGGAGAHGFPMSLPTDSDLHDPFFPSPVPSPSLLQPVLHSSNAQSFTIIPLTVHRHHGGGGTVFATARGSDSSADSPDSWIPGSAAKREHSAEVHHGPLVIDETQKRNVDSNHNDTKTVQRHPPPSRRPGSANGIRSSNLSRSSFSSFSSTSSNSQRRQQQQRQPLFHSRSAGVLREAGGAVNAVDSCESDDGGLSPVEGRQTWATISRRRWQDDEPKKAAILSRGRSSSHTVPGSRNSNRARLAVSTTPPPTATCQAATTTVVIGRDSVSSISSGSDCVVVGVVNSGNNNGGRGGTSSGKNKRTRNAINDQAIASESLESL